MRKLLNITALVSVALMSVSAPAQASEQTGTFCNVTDAGVFSCYDSEPALLHAISDGRINIEADASRAEIAAAIEQSNSAAEAASKSGASARQTVILGQMWVDASYIGASLTFQAGNTCTSGVNASFNNLASPYNNSATSIQLFAGCYGRGYDASTASGSGTQFQFTYEQHVPNLGSFNDLMSSVKFCHASC